jgi:Sensors of blue-light using FAD.
MFFLVYVSSATRPFSREDLRVLLETCRKNNAELGVTGMLLYKDGNFMQGPRRGRGGGTRALREDRRRPPPRR